MLVTGKVISVLIIIRKKHIRINKLKIMHRKTECIGENLDTEIVVNFIFRSIQFNYKCFLHCHLIFTEIFFNIMLKRIQTSSRFQIIKVIPSIRSRIKYKLLIPSFAFRKDSFNFLIKECVIILLSPTGQRESSKQSGYCLF